MFGRPRQHGKKFPNYSPTGQWNGASQSVPDRASVHTRNTAFEAVSAREQYCSVPLLKVERSASDRFLKRSESSLNTFIGAEIATEPRFGKLSFQIKRERCKLHNGICSHWECFGTISASQQNINSCSHCTGATFETEQKSIRYSVKIASVRPPLAVSSIPRSLMHLSRADKWYALVWCHVCPVAWLKRTKLCPCLSYFPGFFGHFESLVFVFENGGTGFKPGQSSRTFWSISQKYNKKVTIFLKKPSYFD